MAKGLFRNIKNYIVSKLHPSTPKIRLGDEVISKPLPHENDSLPPQKQKPSVSTTTVKDMKTGEYSQAEVVNGKMEHGIEKSSSIPNSQPSQMDKVKVRARNEAYIKAVKGLMVMNLDADIFTDAMDELHEKYYGKTGVPDEVASIVETLTQKIHIKK